MHFHVCVVDGVFEEVVGDADVHATAPDVIFHPATGIDAAAVVQVQATLRRRILRAFVGRSLLESFEAQEMLAPNSPLRAAVTAMAAPKQQAAVQPAQTGAGGGAPTQLEPAPPPPKRSKAHYLWAVLIARIYEVFPLLCPLCGGQMRIIAFITHRADIRQILDHIGVDSELPHISPARGPPLWDDCGTQTDDGTQIEPNWDLVAQPAPEFDVDQRVNW